MKPLSTRLLGLLAGSVLALTAGLAAAQKFPDKPIRIIVPYAPGGMADAQARMIGARLQERWSVPVVVENKPGAGTIIGTNFVVKSPADGYTVLYSASPLTILPSLNKDFTVDPRKDLAPIGQLARGRYLIAVPSELPVKTLQELVAYSKANPGKLNYSTPGTGTSPHIAWELFKSRTGAVIQHVPYNGSSLAVMALLRGEVQVTMEPSLTLKPHIDTGKMRPLAVTSLERHPQFPSVPTVAETVAPGFSVQPWVGFLTTGGTPQEVVRQLNKEINEIVREPRMNNALTEIAYDPVTESPAYFSDVLAKEITMWAQVIKEANITLDK
ncbi:tripartite tricarboxylate transporter substrate binding protein [Hydrogenophaga sp. BPS33]|uniref:tripartite tricarboxylate transporter substrate binding protein n=1 Tax=Hydrogenophaga sp. BPS33 TaxID=2651974 RepID=UPI00135C4933|nr:tripartite tricarboxylate transporter substrate binding protein [Hydrogenophaga sp. BPS33]